MRSGIVRLLLTWLPNLGQGPKRAYNKSVRWRKLFILQCPTEGFAVETHPRHLQSVFSAAWLSAATSSRSTNPLCAKTLCTVFASRVPPCTIRPRMSAFCAPASVSSPTLFQPQLHFHFAPVAFQFCVDHKDGTAMCPRLACQATIRGSTAHRTSKSCTSHADNSLCQTIQTRTWTHAKRLPMMRLQQCRTCAGPSRTGPTLCGSRRGRMTPCRGPKMPAPEKAALLCCTKAGALTAWTLVSASSIAKTVTNPSGNISHKRP